MSRLLYFVEITSGDAEYIHQSYIHVEKSSLHSIPDFKTKMFTILLFEYLACLE